MTTEMTEPKVPIGGRRAPRDKLDLTTREMEVAVRLAKGYNNHEIAGELGISVKTVDTHRGHVLDKLDLANNVMLARHALRVGWVTL